MLLIILLLMCVGIVGLCLLAIRCLSLAVGRLVLRLWGRGLAVGQRRLSRGRGRGGLVGSGCLLWLSSFGLRLGGCSLCLVGGRLGLRVRHSVLLLHVGVGRRSRRL